MLREEELELVEAVGGQRGCGRGWGKGVLVPIGVGDGEYPGLWGC